MDRFSDLGMPFERGNTRVIDPSRALARNDDVSIDLAKTLSADLLFGLFGLETPAGRGRR